MSQGIDLTHIGVIGRRHGMNGELRLQLVRDIVNEDADGDIPDCLFIEIDGLPVPYFVDEWRERGTDTMIVKFDDINSDQDAIKLTGCKVFAETSELPHQEGIRSWKDFVGYEVQQADGKTVGTVNAVDDRNENILLYVSTPQESEVILPLHEDLLLDIDETKHTIRLSIPDGLLSLNE